VKLEVNFLGRLIAGVGFLVGLALMIETPLESQALFSALLAHQGRQDSRCERDS